MGYDSQRIAEVRRLLEGAFAATPVPEEGHVTACTCEECRDFLVLVEGRPWREVEREILLLHRDRLPFLTPAGYRHYLPAYLLASLDEGPEARRVLQSTLLYLGGRVPAHIDPILRRYIARFAPEEARAVVLFLTRISEKDPDPEVRDLARGALENYWRAALSS